MYYNTDFIVYFTEIIQSMAPVNCFTAIDLKIVHLRFWYYY